MFLYEFTKTNRITTCPRTIICNTCEQMYVSGDILNAVENVDYQEYYGFPGSFFKSPPIVIDESTLKKLMKMNRTPPLNIDEQ